jgi:3',5'-cyclic AMP phosphodiesterase CpdA
LIEGYRSDTAILNGEWEEIEHLLSTLDMPVYLTVGNHDIGNAESVAVWQQRFGPTYYSFVYENVLFVSLNTEDPPIALPPEILKKQEQLEAAMAANPVATQARILEGAAKRPEPVKLPGSVAISDDQFNWFQKTLAAHPEVHWTIVLMHKPIWRYQHPRFADMERLLADRPFTMIAGHEHYYAHDSRNGRDFVTMGTTGGVWLRDGPGRVDHIAWIAMTKSGPVLTNISIDGVFPIEGPD